MRRVAVIGGGASGAMAALSAKEAGAEVLVMRRALGATALSSGAIDLAGDPWEVGGDRWRDHINAARALREMVKRNRLHPLAPHVERVSEALNAFTRHVPIYEPRSLTSHNLVLPTDLGTWKSTFMAQKSQTAADLLGLEGKHIRVVGLRGWGNFRSHFIAASLEHLALRGGIRVNVAAVDMEVADEQLALRESHELARQLQDDGVFATELRRIAAGADLALVPPVLGLERMPSVPACEVLASDQSVPGLRLQRALDEALEHVGVQVVTGEVVPDGYDAYVLASGRFLGGGIVRSDKRFHEPVFDSAVFIRNALAKVHYLGELSGKSAAGPHPWMQAGVRVDEDMRPIGPDARPVRDDIFAAGSVIGGYDPVVERCGLGTAIVTGWVAGRKAAGRA